MAGRPIAPAQTGVGQVNPSQRQLANCVADYYNPLQIGQVLRQSG